jgi:hypothetical protein
MLMMWRREIRRLQLVILFAVGLVNNFFFIQQVQRLILFIARDPFFVLVKEYVWDIFATVVALSIL